MILDFAKSAQALKAKRGHAQHNQRLATICGKNPTLFSNPVAMRLMLLSQEAQDGMA